MRWVAGTAGALILVVTTLSILRNLVVPRGLSSRLNTVTLRSWRCVLRAIAVPWKGTPESWSVRDRVLAWHAPLVLITMLMAWLGGMFLAYGLLLHAVAPLGWTASFREAGSSLFTLGYASTDRLHLNALDFVAAATGPLVIALQIAYLPTLYNAYNRRETEVTILSSRAGEPAWGPELLARQGLVGTVDELRDLYGSWERLAADIGESHTNYPALLIFRSPKPYRSWIIALITVMDGAAMHLALAPGNAPREARLVLRAGFTALRDIADVIGVGYDGDPKPENDLRLTFLEFAAAAAMVIETGFPHERTIEDAWPHFQGWRVNYEHIAYEIARRVDAVPALWSGPRDFPSEPMPPRRPVDRRPGDTGRPDTSAIRSASHQPEE